MKRILFVCTGNICRSPTADGVLRRHAKGLDIEVDSAGTQSGHIGQPPDPRTIAAARKRGYDLTPLRARNVCVEDFNDFDLILAMDKTHHEALIDMAPAGSRAEIGMFLEYAPDCGYTDVPDPYYGGPADFEIVVDLVEKGVQGLLGALRA